MAKKSKQQEAPAIDTPTKNYAILYTDGGFRGGFAGYGVHGYVHNGQESKTGTGNPKVAPTIQGYNSPSRRMEGVRVLPEFYYDHFGTMPGKHTNNTAEIMAAKHAIEFALNKKIDELTIIGDSEYVLKTINSWLDKYARNGWRRSNGEPVANTELWQEVYALRKQYLDSGAKLRTDWVKGHSGEPGNEKADRLASTAVSQTIRGKDINKSWESQAQGYWKNNVEPHPFLMACYHYFESDEATLRPGIYFLGDNRLADYQEGKRSSDASISVVRLKQPDTILETVRNVQCQLANGLRAQMRGNMANIFSPTTVKDIENIGVEALSCPNPIRLDMACSMSIPLTVEYRPLGLAGRIMDVATNLERILESFFDAQEGTSRIVEFLEVTDCFYTTSIKPATKNKETKKVTELLADIVVGTPKIDLPIQFAHCKSKEVTDIKKINIPFILGYDLLDRNALKRLEAFHPKIYTLTWTTSDKSFDYAVVITTEQGDNGIWAAPYTNHRIVV